MENIVWLAPTDRRDLSGAARDLLALTLGFIPLLAADENGKPYLPARPDLQISLTHTRGAVACAVSACPVGIDLERADRKISAALAKRYYTASERAWAMGDLARLVAVWTRKEAFLKRDGRGIRLPLREVETHDHPEISTQTAGPFVVSFCGTPAEFILHEKNLG